jgi:hypothetical protein
MEIEELIKINKILYWIIFNTITLCMMFEIEFSMILITILLIFLLHPRKYFNVYFTNFVWINVNYEKNIKSCWKIILIPYFITDSTIYAVVGKISENYLHKFRKH